MSARLDRYLDRLFDLLAGSGAAGRRTLTETEAHLNEHIEDLIAQGHAPDVAAREAIARFGSPEVVAGAVAGVNVPGRTALRQAVGAGWVFTATVLITAGVSGALCWIVGCLLGPMIMAPAMEANMHDTAACATLMAAHPGAHDCMHAAVMNNFDAMVFSAAVSGIAGCALLALFFAARASRSLAAYTVLPPKSLMFAFGVVAFGFAAAVWFVDGIDDYQRSIAWDWSYDFARGGASMLTALFFVGAAAREARRPI